MNSEEKLQQAIDATEQMEREMEQEVETLKRKQEELKAPDALSQSFIASGTGADASEAPDRGKQP
jgi:hypothetical protein